METQEGAKLAAEPLVLGLHGRLGVDKHQARHAVDDNLVSRLDDPRRFGDARDRWRTHRARQDRAVRELAAPFGHEAPHLVELEPRSDRGQQLLRDDDGAFGDFRAFRPALL